MALAPVQLLHPEVMREQFFERQALLGGMSALGQRLDVGAGRGTVDEGQCVGQREQLQIAAQIVRQQFLEFQPACVHSDQRLVGQ